VVRRALQPARWCVGASRLFEAITFQGKSSEPWGEQSVIAFGVAAVACVETVGRPRDETVMYGSLRS
jgi:hypothetical protein